MAFVSGLIAGRIIDAIGSHPSGLPARSLAWTGAFEHPTAWDYAWSRVSDAEWAAVEITTTHGTTYNVLFDEGSRVELSPNPREAFFDTEFDFDDNQEVEVREHEGIFIEAGEVIALRFLHIEVEQVDEQDGAE